MQYLLTVQAKHGPAEQIIVDKQDYGRLCWMSLASDAKDVVTQYPWGTVRFWKVVLGLEETKGGRVKHLNGNSKDFRRENLRAYGIIRPAGRRWLPEGSENLHRRSKKRRKKKPDPVYSAAPAGAALPVSVGSEEPA